MAITVYASNRTTGLGSPICVAPAGPWSARDENGGWADRRPGPIAVSVLILVLSLAVIAANVLAPSIFGGRASAGVRTPCAAIHWVLNPAHDSTDVLDDLVRAFRTLGELTGLTFVYDGLTSRSPTDASQPTTKIVVAWVTSEHVNWRSAVAKGHMQVVVC